MPPIPSGKGAATSFLSARVEFAILDRFHSESGGGSEDHFLTRGSWHLSRRFGQATDDSSVGLGSAEVTEELQ